VIEFISASDIERYGYCPLSWWLGLQKDVTGPSLEEGERRHEEISKKLDLIRDKGTELRDWEMLVIIFAVIATALAVIGVSMMSFENAMNLSAVLGLISIPWGAAALFMWIRADMSVKAEKKRIYFYLVIVYAIIAVLIVINSITILGVEPEIAIFYEIVALILLAAACISMYFSITTDRMLKEQLDEEAIEGEIIYVGRDDSRLFRSLKYGLCGRPDFILEINGNHIPVEVKTGRRPRGPLFSHILQVAAYCLLLTEEEGRRVPYGILRYGNVNHEIEFSEELESLLISKLHEMRNAMRTGKVHRNHQREGKCRNCSRRNYCPERLV